MLLDNKKVAKFLGFNSAQFNKLMSIGKISFAIVKENKECNRYYILRADFEKWLGRRLAEHEFETLKRKEKIKK